MTSISNKADYGFVQIYFDVTAMSNFKNTTQKLQVYNGQCKCEV